MNISIKKVDSDFVDLDKIDRLNKEAFPEPERIEIDDILNFVKDGHMDCLTFYDERLFVGFMTVMVTEKIVYISFFAIQSNLRSRGYGSNILKMIKKCYPNHCIIIDIEPLDENAENYNQRKTRKLFYERNGFFSSGYFWSYFGMTFELLCNKKFFKDEFIELVNNFKSEKFDPMIFETPSKFE